MWNHIRFGGFRASVLLMCTMISGCASIFNIDKHIPESDEPVVQNVPPGTFDRQDIAPYSGPHPRLLRRPDDPFKYPIHLGELGPVQPYIADPLHYPFLCQTQESGLGQPVVDNQEGYGIAVYEEVDGVLTDKIIGYSQDCSIPTSARYFFNPVDTEDFVPFDDTVSDDAVTQIEVNGRTVPFIVRVEWGTINRHIYTIIALKGEAELLEQPSADHWNKRLIMAFRGGVGIGFRQGKHRVLGVAQNHYEQLAKGYAVATSSGLKTSNHYNIWLSEELVTRVKQQFVSLYGEPLYTVGLGASGGGISQYLLAQNRPGLIDAAIPQYSYPDMVSQTIYALDCDLLEHYFDLGDRQNPFWEKWENRTLIEGLSGRSVKEHEFEKIYQWSKLVNGFFPTRPRGINECVFGWRGPGQVAHNPRYTHYYYRFDQEIVRKNHWTHWENLKHFYGTDDHGFANALWDNTGVQYGLAALLSGDIDFTTFIDINRHVGSWRPQHEMEVARFWRFSGPKDKLTELNIWSHQNMRTGSTLRPAPRGVADPKAIAGAFRSGMVFVGVADLPIIDIRHYVDDIQDMHHSFASMTTRQRILDGMGNADHHVIWMARRGFNPTNHAFEVIDKWMLNRLENSSLSLVESKPAEAVDACFDDNGQRIHEGAGVWDGQWNNQPQGECLKLMPNFRSSRQIAGEDIRDLTFKCQTISIETAFDKGMYAGLSPTDEHLRLLKKTFPDGVCDYALPGLGEYSAQELGL